MNFRSRTVAAFGLLTLSLMLTGCPSVGGYGSRAYEPLPKFEAKYLAESHRDIFPGDFKTQPEKFKGISVAWTGLVRKIEFRPDSDTGKRVARLTVEHRYFDWIEDYGAQPENLFLSTRGEGDFFVYRYADEPGDRAFIDQFAVGDMIIAYGPVETGPGGQLSVSPVMTMRGFKPSYFRSDAWNYGRPSEPNKILKHYDTISREWVAGER